MAREMWRSLGMYRNVVSAEDSMSPRRFPALSLSPFPAAVVRDE
jgi:hypothetical protein